MRRLVGLLALALLVGVIGYALFGTGSDIPDPGVLVVELEGQLEEVPPVDSVARFLARGPALPTLLLQLEKAAFDERIVAALVHVRELRASWAQIQELREGIQRLRANGKSVVALLDVSNFNATRQIYLASAADRVYVTPGTLGPLAGLSGQYLFVGRFLAKLGVGYEYERIGRYKSAPEALADDAMSPAAREMTDELLDTLYDQILDGIARGRELDPARVRELVDRAPATAEELVDAGLADAVAGRESVLEAAGLQAEEVPYSDYVAVDPRELGLRTGPSIGLIFGSGTIVSTSGRDRPRAGFAADHIARALDDAARDDDIRAIVLRIDSGGGSSLASEELWRAVRAARKRKPVVVSMGTAAASGGYYVASAADAVVALPATQTGSIGIFFLRPTLGGLYEKLEIGVERFTRGRFAALTSEAEPLSEEQRAYVQRFLQSLYGEFVARVAEGRSLSPERIRELGEGKVWLGAPARDLGLVDEVGGLYEAVARAKREAGIDAAEDPERVVLPGPRSLLDQLREFTGGSLGMRLAEALLPVELPPVVRAWLELAPVGPVYLPARWVALD